MYSLTIFKNIRHHLYKILDQNSIENLNKVPEGFNNNIFWNIAHCVATQQLLHYYLSEKEIMVDMFWVDNFKKGTFPKDYFNQEQKNKLKILLLDTQMDLDKNIENDAFKHYNAYTTSFGVSLQNIKEAIEFNNTHEALHLGYCLALQRAI